MDKPTSGKQKLTLILKESRVGLTNGFILGTETGKLEPMATATRAQLAAVVARYCQSIH